METLRQEILQSQQARSDLLKWKLGLVGAIGTVGLGLAGSRASAHADLVLCAVPLVCVYVDLLCRHLNLRILVIGVFLRKQSISAADDGAEPTILRAYESHVDAARQIGMGGAFALEDWAVTWSTIVLSLAVALYGVVVRGGSSPDHVSIGWAFTLSGCIGFLTTVGSQVLYRVKARQVTRLVSYTAVDGARHDQGAILERNP